ncbi:MAG: periplasmic heavy metal sensor [candidate division Zixibacteria bacterium]|nr:periplasmic heavy metal sensor [candidate division Zixibacteria bacterium]
MKGKVLIIALVASVALNVGALATFLYRSAVKAEAPRRPHRLAHELELTDEQREAMRARRERTFEEMAPLRRELRRKRGEVLALLKEPEVDAARRDRLFAEIARLQMQLELKAFENMRETKRTLRPEQQERFLKHVEERFRHRREDFTRGRVRRPGGRGFERKTMRERSGEGE